MKNKLPAILIIPFIISTFSACSAEGTPAVTNPSQSFEPTITTASVNNEAKTAETESGININEIAYAEIDRYLEEQTKRSDGLGIERFSFGLSGIDSSLSVVYSVERFDVAAEFTVKPMNAKEYKKEYPDGEEDFWGNIRLFRWFTIEKNGERYEVTGLKTEAPHNAYTAEHLLKAFPDTVPAPDGTSLGQEEAVLAYRNNLNHIALKFDFGYLRYAAPIFQCSYDDPDSYDFEEKSFKTPYPEYIDEPEYFRVKGGDTLECGLTVKNADWHVDFKSGPRLTLTQSSIEFAGEVTWEGILYCHPEEDFRIEKGDLVFYPDPLKNKGVPIICGKDWKSEETGKPAADLVSLLFDDLALESGAGAIDLGNISRFEEMYGGIFENGNVARVKITLKNLVFETDESGSKSYAEGISCEKIG